MKLTDGERLIVALLCDISRKLDAGREIDPDLVMKSLGRHEWGLTWEYGGLFDEDTPPAVSETADILTMWDILEHSYAALPPTDRARVDAALGAGRVWFAGFDGNSDEHFGIAHFLINDLQRFTHFAKRDLNSHSSTSLPRYRAMLSRFKLGNFLKLATADQIITIVGER